MAYKKGKGTKQKNVHEKDEQKKSDIDAQKKNISASFLDELKWAFTKFDTLEESERDESYGNKEYLEQFWEYFKKNHPNLLDKIDKKDLPVYIQTLEDKWFSIENIKENTNKLHEEFKHEDTELQVIDKSLSELQKFCADDINNVPDGTFKKFADAAWFDHSTLEISPDGEIHILDNLPVVWKIFLEKEGIELWKTATAQAERILTPNYNPTERIVVTVAIAKIKKELKGSLKTAFSTRFPLSVDIFSSCQDLLTFRDELKNFLDDHASEIDQSLAKKLDSIIVTNGDIYKELSKSWRKFDDTKWFSEREQYFRRIFNKLVTRQLFEEVQKKEETIDHYITAMGNTFKEFPPYVNDILQMEEYRFNAKNISVVDPSFDGDMHDMEDQIVDLDTQFKTAPDDKKNELRGKIKAVRQQMEQRRWQAYIIFLRTKNAPLAEVFAQLVGSNFDFSVLSVDHQQLLVNVLIKNKLEDTIKNKVPELLSVKEEELTQFVHDLFDLKKMDITIPTRYGPVPLTFLKKEFLASVRTQLPTLNDLEDIKNLPLNFVTQLTDSNAAFFEDSLIFNSLYEDFVAKNGKFRVNDWYKVSIKKDGKTVEWYLSAYCPIDEYNTNREDRNGKELYLYSEPISAPNQERELVLRPHEEWKSSIPVVIKDTDQAACDLEILDKKINLNGDAFWALLFGYVLGQQSMNTSMSSEREKELAEKIGTLDTYKEKEEWEEEVVEPVVETPEKSLENSEKDKFKADRKNLKWYWFPEEKYKDNSGFVIWSRLFMPFASSEVPPIETGRAWVQMEITHINEAKWTFTVKFHGGELRLGKFEWATKELPIHSDSIKGIKTAFGDNLYKVPDMTWISFDQQMDKMMSWLVAKDLDKYFWSLQFNWSKFTYTLWNYVGKEITHFGVYEPKAIGESVDLESGKLILYKIKPNSNGTITVSGDSTKNNYAKNFPARDMDYPTFMLFIKEKWLQPKCKEQVQEIDKKSEANEEETPLTARWFSINNLFSFFKNGVSKLQDGIKKYDEARTEDLTDILTNKGQLWGKIWWYLSPFSRISGAFGAMGAEAFLDRDNRVWKKIDAIMKYFDDYDYTKLYNSVIGPMLAGKIKVVPHYKIAAMLLIHLKKWKWPYAKNLPTAEGKRVGLVLGNDHQERYLAIREKRIRDLEQNAHIYGGPWADQVKNELVELEMRYIVHVMDGRHMWVNDDDKTKYRFQDKYSKKFCDELETAYTWFYKQSTVEEWFTKNQDVNFEFARVEYFRQLADRPQQALPFLKVMATKAINDTQWQVFETAVLTWLLSWVFLNMTYSTTQSYIQKICRTRWFIPWIFAKDIRHQSKMQRLLDLFSENKFTTETKYNPTEYSYRQNKWPWGFINTLVDSKKPGNGRMEVPWRMKKISDFLQLTWKNDAWKTLLDLYADPTLSMSDKLLLEEYINKSNEKNESLDSEVEQNTSSLTWSILTKSQSVVEKMIKIDQDGFAWKDGDAKQNMADFSSQMEEAISSHTNISETTINILIEKFFNWFPVFSWAKKTELIKRLKRCQNHKESPDVEDIMYYTIVWEILNSVARPPAHVPEELEWALNARKSFFVQNIDIILSPSAISSSFGIQYIGDLKKYASPELVPWEESAMLLDREDKAMATYWLSKEEQKPIKDIQNKFRRQNCVNKPLYDTADTLFKKCWVTNRFRKETMSSQKNTSDNKKLLPPKATWAKIKNAEVTEKVRQILEGKNLEEEVDNNYIPETTYDDDYDNYTY